MQRDSPCHPSFPYGPVTCCSPFRALMVFFMSSYIHHPLTQFWPILFSEFLQPYLSAPWWLQVKSILLHCTSNLGCFQIHYNSMRLHPHFSSDQLVSFPVLSNQTFISSPVWYVFCIFLSLLDH